MTLIVTVTFLDALNNSIEVVCHREKRCCSLVGIVGGSGDTTTGKENVLPSVLLRYYNMRTLTSCRI